MASPALDPALALDERRTFLDPREDRVWRHGGAWWAPLVRRPDWAAIGLGVAMIALTVAIALAADLPLRDADGMLGGRALLLLGTVATFLTLELVPRTWRLRRSGSLGTWEAFRAVIRERWSKRRLRVVLLGLLSFYASYLSYRNLKNFLPFLRPQDLDYALLHFERGIFGGTDPAVWLHELLGTGAVAHVLSSAYLAFLAFVPASVGASLILAVNPVPGLWYVTALGLNWAIGVVCYYALPALGPVFAEPAAFYGLPDTGVSALQQALVDHRLQVLADPFATREVSSIAAFASLHVSVVFTAALIAQLLHLPRPLRLGLWAFLGVTLLGTIYFGWHYVVDDVAGLAIGALAVVVAAACTGHWRVLRERRP